MSKRTTWGELKRMIESEGVSDNTQIILRVRGNSVTDYDNQRVMAYENDYGVLIIRDELDS